MCWPHAYTPEIRLGHRTNDAFAPSHAMRGAAGLGANMLDNQQPKTNAQGRKFTIYRQAKPQDRGKNDALAERGASRLTQIGSSLCNSGAKGGCYPDAPNPRATSERYLDLAADPSRSHQSPRSRTNLAVCAPVAKRDASSDPQRKARPPRATSSRGRPSGGQRPSCCASPPTSRCWPPAPGA